MRSLTVWQRWQVQDVQAGVHRCHSSVIGSERNIDTGFDACILQPVGCHFHGITIHDLISGKNHFGQDFSNLDQYGFDTGLVKAIPFVFGVCILQEFSPTPQ